MLVLQGSPENVERLLFSPDGRRLAVPSRRSGLQVWVDVVAGGQPTVVRDRFSGSILFSPDGEKVLTSGGGSLQTNDLRHPHSRSERFSVGKSYGSCVFDESPDRKRLLFRQFYVGGPKVFCRRWDDLATSTWSVGPTRQVWGGPLFLADDRFLLLEQTAVGQANFVTRDASNGRILSQSPSGGGYVRSMVVSGDRRWLAATRVTRIAVRPTDDLAAEPVVIANDNRKEFTGLTFHPSGRYLAATSNDNTVKLYDVSTWRMAHAFDWQVGRLRSIAFSPDGMLAAAGGDKGKVVVWDFDL